MKVFVHKYKWSHAKMRRLMRRSHKKGRAVLKLTTKDGWLYLITDPTLEKTLKGEI